MLYIPSPPPPELSWAAAGGISAACIILGFLLLLWGRNLHRAFLTLVGAAGGLALAGPVAQRFGLNTTIAQVVAIFTLAILGLACAKIIWVLLAGGLLAFSASVVVLVRYLPALSEDARPAFEAAGATLAAWLDGVWNFFSACLETVWKAQPTLLIFAATVGGGLAILIGLLRGRVVTIFMSALAGAAAIIAGGMILCGQVSFKLWQGAWERYYLPAGLVAVLLLIGLVFQYRGALAADRAAAEAQKAQADKGKINRARAAEKEK